MRNLITIIVLLLSIGLFAQEVKPEFKKEGSNIKATFYHDNGAIAKEGFLRNGKLHGEWTMYNPEGKKIAAGEYLEGKKHGDWFFWKTSGEALREVAYQHGRPVQVIVWNKEKSFL